MLLFANTVADQSAGTTPTPNPESAQSPSNGACHASNFSSAALQAHVQLQEKSSLATLGGRPSDRISANAVGRRGHFPQEGMFSRHLN